MIFSVYVPLVVVALLAWAGPLAGFRLAPAAATRALTAISACAAVLSVGSVALLAAGGLLKLINAPSTVPGGEAWVALRDSVPIPVAGLAMVALVLMAVRAARASWINRRVLAAVRQVVRDASTNLLVLRDAEAYAYAVPIDGGVIVVSSGLMGVLEADERSALLAHERAHLDHHHDRYRRIVHLAAAINPLLRPLQEAVQLQTERWADEAAARTTTRAVAARTLARAALTARTRLPALAFAVDHVTERVRALQGDPRTSRWRAVLPPVLLALVGFLAFLDAVTACYTLISYLTH